MPPTCPENESRQVALGLGMSWVDRPASNRGAVPGSLRPNAPGPSREPRAPGPGPGPHPRAPGPRAPGPGAPTPGPGATGRALGLGPEQRSLGPGPRDAGSKAVPRRVSAAWPRVRSRPHVQDCCSHAMNIHPDARRISTPAFGRKEEGGAQRGCYDSTGASKDFRQGDADLCNVYDFIFQRRPAPSLRGRRQIRSAPNAAPLLRPPQPRACTDAAQKVSGHGDPALRGVTGNANPRFRFR